MTKITKETIDECASNMMFKISEEENEMILQEFDAILAQMDFLSKIPGIDEVTPLTFTNDTINTYLREDVPTTPVDPSVELKNVPSRLVNQVKLPKVVK